MAHGARKEAALISAHGYTALNHLPLDIYKRGQLTRQLLKALLFPKQKVTKGVKELGFKRTPD
jgi:hypothetical protein